MNRRRMYSSMLRIFMRWRADSESRLSSSDDAAPIRIEYMMTPDIIVSTMKKAWSGVCGYPTVLMPLSTRTAQ